MCWWWPAKPYLSCYRFSFIPFFLVILLQSLLVCLLFPKLAKVLFLLEDTSCYSVWTLFPWAVISCFLYVFTQMSISQGALPLATVYVNFESAHYSTISLLYPPLWHSLASRKLNILLICFIHHLIPLECEFHEESDLRLAAVFWETRFASGPWNVSSRHLWNRFMEWGVERADRLWKWILRITEQEYGEYTERICQERPTYVGRRCERDTVLYNHLPF